MPLQQSTTFITKKNLGGGGIDSSIGWVKVVSLEPPKCVHNQMVIVCFFFGVYLMGSKEHSIRSLAHFRSPVFMTTWSLGHFRSPVFMTTWPLGHFRSPVFMTKWSLGHFRSPVFMTTWSLGHTSDPQFLWPRDLLGHRHGPTFEVDWELRTTGDSWPRWWWPDWT